LERNYFGVVGCILGFLGLILPWWALDYSVSGAKFSMSLYLYASSVSQGINGVFGVAIVDWYNWTALALLLTGSVLVFLASMVFEGRRTMVLVGTLLSALALIVFPVGLQMRLSHYSSGFHGVGLFTTGVVSISSTAYLKFSSYLTFGFWLSLVGAFLMFLAWSRYPQEKFEEEQPEPEPAPYVRRPPSYPPPRRPYRY
jgi:hypothetical protein